MGKGDRKTRKGKQWRKTYGTLRRSSKNKNSAVSENKNNSAEGEKGTI